MSYRIVLRSIRIIWRFQRVTFETSQRVGIRRHKTFFARKLMDMSESKHRTKHNLSYSALYVSSAIGYSAGLFVHHVLLPDRKHGPSCAQRENHVGHANKYL